MLFGEMVHYKRRKLKMTQAELAKKVGISRVYLSELERGNCEPSLKVFIRLNLILEIIDVSALEYHAHWVDEVRNDD